MIHIAITQAAFDAIALTLPLGSVAYEQEANANGEREIWLAAHVVNRPRRELFGCHSAAGSGDALALNSGAKILRQAVANAWASRSSIGTHEQMLTLL